MKISGHWEFYGGELGGANQANEMKLNMDNDNAPLGLSPNLINRASNSCSVLDYVPGLSRAVVKNLGF